MIRTIVAALAVLLLLPLAKTDASRAGARCLMRRSPLG